MLSLKWIRVERTWLVGSLVALCLTAWTAPASAAPQPKVVIDVGQVVACREPSSPQPLAVGPDEKVVEAKVNVSVWLQSGSEQDLEQLVLVLRSPERRLRVADYEPRTQLASEINGDVEVNSSSDSSKTFSVAPSGVLGGPYGQLQLQATPASGFGVTQSEGAKTVYHKLSPKELSVASGTTEAEHGVFFKWRRTSQVTLEGSREVTVRLIVPRDWRGDWLEAHSQLSARHKNYLGDYKLVPVAESEVYVGLYEQGDRAAADAAVLLSQAQSTAPGAATAERHTVYKPSAASNSPMAKVDWLSMFKLCSHEEPADADHEDASTRVSQALSQLRVLSRR